MKTNPLAEPLQQIDRTCVLARGRKLAYFAGCDYFRLGSHLEVLAAVRDTLEHAGLNTAASRKTTGNHALYEQLETQLARFAGVPTATLVASGYTTNLAVAQALAGEFTLALIDERAHVSLQDATPFLGCRVVTFAHRDPRAAAHALNRSRTCGRVLLLTDGHFSHSGEIAPLDAYLRELPARVTLLVDDAHGFGILGKNGRGTPEQLGLKPTARLLQTITLSKALGAYGGAILGSRELRTRILERSHLFAGNTPLPLPLAQAALTALEILRAHGGKLRRHLHFNASYIKAALCETGLPLHDGPGPIIALHPRNPRDAAQLTRALLDAGVYPPHIKYPGGPRDGYFRFVISSEHTPAQLDALADTLRQWRK